MVMQKYYFDAIGLTLWTHHFKTHIYF